MQEPPFIAVGGGLAGAAFALELARNHAPVSVLESTRGPHHKVCGEFLSAEAQGLIAYLGIDLAALGATSIGRFKLAAAGQRADAPLPFRAAGLSRHRLDQALLQAAEKAGAVVERGVTVSEMKPAEGCVALRAGSRTFTAKAARSRPVNTPCASIPADRATWSASSFSSVWRRAPMRPSKMSSSS
jgi:menaquinone-9 beta-reductase